MKKILSVVIAITMLLGMMIPMSVSAAEAVECATWDEVVAAVTADPAAGIKLTADVTANATIASFAGSFDGNGKTVTATTTMFAAVTDGATFGNFTFDGEVTCAPFIAVASGTVAITDVTSNATVAVTDSIDMAAFIAKVGDAANITFTNCVNNGDISANKSVGAFIGFCGSELTAAFHNCVNNGAVKTAKGGAHAGGFAGCLETSAMLDISFNRCANNGTVIGDNEGKLETAGFVAFSSGSDASKFIFSDCISAGALDNKSKNDSDKYSASGFVARVKKGVVSFNNCLANVASFSSATNRTANYWFFNEGATLSVSNCYYAEGVALSAAEAEAGFIAATAAQLASGEVAYNLGAAWGQTIGTDAAPVIGGDVVYKYTDGTYSNTEETAPEGTEENPIQIYAYYEIASLSVPAGETVYYAINPAMNFTGKIFAVAGDGATVNGAASVALPNNPMMGWPVVVAIYGGTAGATADLIVPVGTMDNPAELTDGSASIKLDAYYYDGYHFAYTADKAGELTVTAPEGAIITINNLTTFIYGDSGVATATVAEGDLVMIVVATDATAIDGTISVAIADIPEDTTPETTVPETTVPETSAPETSAPETSAPETSAPETSAPETSAPETSAPETSAPETSAPETTAPSEPETGDNSFAIVLAVVAVAAIGCVAINLRKREEN